MGSQRTPAQQEAALKFAQCMRDNGITNFPDPTPNGPIINVNGAHSIPGFEAAATEVQRHLRGPDGPAGPVMRKKWVVAGAAVLVAVGTIGAVVATSGSKQPAQAAQRAASEHRDGATGEALGHGLGKRDPDLPGAIGRIAVHGDQPGPGDLHRAARSGPGDQPRSGALPGERQPGGVALRLDTGLPEPDGRGEWRRCGRAQLGSGRARLCHLGPAQPHDRFLRLGHHPRPGKAPSRPGSDPERHAQPRPSGIRACGATSVGHLGAVGGKRPERTTGYRRPPRPPGSSRWHWTPPSRPRWRSGTRSPSPCPTTKPPPEWSPRWGRSRPAHRVPGSTGSNSNSAAPGTDSCSSGNSGSVTPTITVDVTPSDPAATGTWDQAPVQVGITTASVPNALAVPVTALLAQASGGYSVEVISPDGTNHLVGVSLGLFDDAQGLVQVTGPGLAAGQKVVVPST